MITETNVPIEKPSSSEKDQSLKIPKKPAKLKRLRKSKTRIIIFHPEKQIKMIVYYRIPGDMHIAERNSSLHSYNVMKDVNNIKKITSIFDDKEFNFVGCNLISTLEYSPPLELLMHRLQSLGDSDAYTLSKTVESVGNIISSFKNFIKPRKNMDIINRPSFQAFFQQNLELIKKIGEKYPVIVYHHNNFEMSFDYRLTQMNYSYKLIQMLGSDKNKFIQQLKNKGLPECVWMDGDFFNIMDRIIKTVYFPVKDTTFPVFRIKRKGSFFIPKQKFLINRFEEEDFVFAFYIQILFLEENELASIDVDQDKVSNKKENNISLSVSEKKEKCSLLIEENRFKNDTLRWVKSSYPNLNIIVVKNEEKDQTRRCGYKELTF